MFKAKYLLTIRNYDLFIILFVCNIYDVFTRCAVVCCMLWMHHSQSEQLWLNVIFLCFKLLFVTRLLVGKKKKSISPAPNEQPELLGVYIYCFHWFLRNLFVLATMNRLVVERKVQKFHAPRRQWKLWTLAKLREKKYEMTQFTVCSKAEKSGGDVMVVLGFEWKAKIMKN